jgi:hypothetical protein
MLGAQGERRFLGQAGRALHTVNQGHDDRRVSNAPTHAHVKGGGGMMRTD